MKYFRITKKQKNARSREGLEKVMDLVPETGVEPAQPCGH